MNGNAYQNIVFNLLKRLNLLSDNLIQTSQLDYLPNVAKRLDEHRELIEDIEKHTGYFSSEQGRWSRAHALALDEYLQYLVKLRNAPQKGLGNIRKQPKVLCVEEDSHEHHR